MSPLDPDVGGPSSTRNPLGAQQFYDRWTRALNQRDYEVLKRIAHPRIVMRPLAGLWADEYHGHNGIRVWLHETKRLAVSVSGSVVDATPQRIMVAGTLSASTVRGPSPDLALFWVMTVRERHVLSDVAFLTLEGAERAFDGP